MLRLLVSRRSDPRGSIRIARCGRRPKGRDPQSHHKIASGDLSRAMFIARAASPDQEGSLPTGCGVRRHPAAQVSGPCAGIRSGGLRPEGAAICGEVDRFVGLDIEYWETLARVELRTRQDASG